jgi:sialic acid synthase
VAELFIAGRRIADDEPPYVIAEVGHNHQGDLAIAQKMIRVASDCGADAVKFQKRDNATLYTAALLEQPYCNEASYGPTYGAHRAALEFETWQYQACLGEAHRVGIACFATAFDEPSADFLEALGVPAFKIHSGGLTDHALLAHVASFGKPIILSTGGGTAADIDRAVHDITAHTSQLALLHCTAAYPVRDFSELNLRCILTLRARYPEFVVGWSGHDSGIAMALVAYAFGARIIEKHFTLNRANKGTDHPWSLEPTGLTKLVRDLQRAYVALGDGVKRFYPSEKAPISKMRRTLQGDGRWQIDGRS